MSVDLKALVVRVWGCDDPHAQDLARQVAEAVADDLIELVDEVMTSEFVPGKENVLRPMRDELYDMMQTRKRDLCGDSPAGETQAKG